jgi:hypothetical protein
MIRAVDVYDVLGLPAGLRTHMTMTMAVVRLIGAQAAEDMRSVVRDVELTMALHDVGNPVKFDFDAATAVAMLGEPSETLPRWRLYSEYMQARYGEDDHVATGAILNELKVRPDLIELVSKKSSHHFAAILTREVPAEMLALYADMRVAPTGIVSIEERYREASERYANSGRVGLGGTVKLEQLSDLETAVCTVFNSCPGAVTPSRAGFILEDCLNSRLDEAFLSA